MAIHVQIKRIYEMPDDKDGHRILIDRLWPRGIRKADANLDEWNKAIAPSAELRKWFGHREDRFADFAERYRRELRQKNGELGRLRKIADKDGLTLLYGAKSEKINQAVVLQQVLETNE
ncbi:conserved hypothetical protein [Candidatus Zixiibacteriota bacterium]|nr:conserved hypothetical protein [candidate division Zixibacteria bacterium]